MKGGGILLIEKNNLIPEGKEIVIDLTFIPLQTKSEFDPA